MIPNNTLQENTDLDELRTFLAKPGPEIDLSDSSGFVTPREEKGNVWVSLDNGTRARMTIVGSWLVLFSTFGYLYSFGVYQDYYTRIFLNSHSPSQISWIGSLQLMMPFALGIISGKLFDAGYFHSVTIVGSLIFTFSLFMLSLSKPHQYYQVFLSQGIGMGFGTSLTFVPSTSVAVRHFKRRPSLASGIVLSGGAAGAIVFPIMLNHLIPTIGFGDGVRATAYIVTGFLVLGNWLMKLPLGHSGPHHTPDIKSFFKDPAYNWGIFGALIALFGLYFPVIYLQLYAVEHNVDDTLAFYSLAIINAASIIGRIIGNFSADVYGPWNIYIPCTFLTGGMIWAVLGVHNAVSLVVVSILYGILSGAWLSLSVACLTSLAASPEEVGARTGLGLALASFGALGSAPAQGALLTDKFLWIRPIAFSGTLFFVSAAIFCLARMFVVRRKGTQRV